jgi:hypothetical protein
MEAGWVFTYKASLHKNTKVHYLNNPHCVNLEAYFNLIIRNTVVYYHKEGARTE